MRRYNPDDFEIWASDVARRKKAIVDGGSIKLDPDAEAPAAKLVAMIQLDADFGAVWLGHRKFPSQSERDLSLADRLATAGWSDQEIIDSLIANRRLHGGPDKADRGQLRLDYYLGRIALARTARTNGEREETRSGAEAILAHKLSKSPEPDPPEVAQRQQVVPPPDVNDPAAKERRDWLDNLSSTLGVRILRLVRYAGDPASYHLWLEGTHVHMGGVESLRSRWLFASKVYDASGRSIAPIKQKTWEAVVQPSLARIMEHERLGDEAGPEDRVDAFLARYLDSVGGAGYDRAVAIASRSPWAEGGVVYAFLDSLMRYQMVKTPMGAGIARTTRELAQLMRVSGHRPRTFAYVRKDGRSTSVSAWEVGQAPQAQATYNAPGYPPPMSFSEGAPTSSSD